MSGYLGKYLHESAWEQALKYYKKAFKINGSLEIREKINNLEKGLS